MCLCTNYGAHVLLPTLTETPRQEYGFLHYRLEFHLPFLNIIYWDESDEVPGDLWENMDLSFLSLRSRQPDSKGLTKCGLIRGQVSFALIGHDRYQYTIYCFVRGCDSDSLGSSDDPEVTGGGGTPDPISNQVQPQGLLESRSEFITALDFRVEQVSQSWNTRVCELKAAISSHVGLSARYSILPPFSLLSRGRKLIIWTSVSQTSSWRLKAAR